MAYNIRLLAETAIRLADEKHQTINIENSLPINRLLKAYELEPKEKT